MRRRATASPRFDQGPPPTDLADICDNVRNGCIRLGQGRKRRIKARFTTAPKLIRLWRPGRSRLRNRSPGASHLNGHATRSSRPHRTRHRRRNRPCGLRQVPEAPARRLARPGGGRLHGLARGADLVLCQPARQSDRRAGDLRHAAAAQGLRLLGRRHRADQFGHPLLPQPTNGWPRWCSRPR